MLNHYSDDITIDMLKELDPKHHEYVDNLIEGLMCKNHDVKKFAFKQFSLFKN